jgi:hypothetical protein
MHPKKAVLFTDQELAELLRYFNRREQQATRKLKKLEMERDNTRNIISTMADARAGF